MTQRVKVGADEWLVADASKTTLMTDGLSGCVAIGIAAGDKIALAHVYSECSQKNDNWASYEAALDKALADSGLAVAKGTPAHVVYSDPSDKWLAGHIADWLKDKGFEVKAQMAPGCAIGAVDGAVALRPKNESNRAEFLNGYKTSADADAAVTRTALSEHARSAQPATVVAREEFKAPPQALDVRMSDSRHPAHGVYNEILGKIPKELVNCETDQEKPLASEARQLASAMTVEYLKHGGGARIDKIAEGVGKGEGTLFLATDPPIASGHAMAVPLAKADNEVYPQLERDSEREAQVLCRDQAAKDAQTAEQQRVQRTAATLN